MSAPTIALHDLGGSGPVVLLLHATGFSGRTYDPLAPVLREHAHVFAVDLPGHGQASAPEGDEPLSWLAAAAELGRVVEAALGRAVLLLGHSMGGAIALRLASARPELVTAAYVYQPSVLATGASPAAKDELAVSSRRRRATFPSAAAAREACARREPFARFRADALDAYVAHGFTAQADGTVTLSCTPEDEARTYLGNDIRPTDVAGARCPVTIAHGRPGEFGGALVPPAAATALPHATVLPHDDLTHFGPLEDPDRIAREALVALRR